MKPAALAKAIELIAALFILVLVYTALGKLLAHHAFTITLKSSPLIGFASGVLSWAVPAIELAVSAMLFFPRSRKMGLMAALALMMAFTIYIVYIRITSSYLPSFCGGVITKLSFLQHLWLNVFLTALAAAAILLNKRLKLLLQ